MNDPTALTRRRFSSLRQAGAGLLCVALAGSNARAAAEPAAGKAPGGDHLESPTAIPTPEQMAEDPAGAGLALFDLLEGAERAEKQKDYATAVKYYQTLARVVPERATAFSKLCELYEALGQREPAIIACFRATGLEGAKVADNLRYARLLLNTPEGRPLTTGESAAVRLTLEHLAQARVESPEFDLLGCQFAVSIENHDAMRGCVQRLEQTQPGSPLALTYRMSLALFERDFAHARSLIEEARRMSMNPESIALMVRELDSLQDPGSSSPGSGASPRSWLVRWVVPAGGFAAALTALAFLVRGKRRRPKAA
jgi:hypothetical protein